MRLDIKRSIVLVSILLIFIIGFATNQNVYSEDPLTVSTDKPAYTDGEIILVSGKVGYIFENYPVSLNVFDPNGKLVTLQQIDVDSDRNFSTTFVTGGPAWETFGVYTIKVLYVNQARTAETTFQYEELRSQFTDNDSDGVPDSEDKCPSYVEKYNGYLDDDGCPDILRIKPPFQKELLNGDEYIPIVYSFNFTKKPLMAISFGENNYEQFQKVIPSVKNGIKMWTDPLEQKFGMDWSVDFVIITPQKQLQVKPDLIFNIETVESNEKCLENQGWSSQPIDYDPVKKIYKARIPVNIYHCYKLETLEDAELFSWLPQVSYEPASAHEFFHALGFGHTYNKEVDFMCGASEGISCPQREFTTEERDKQKIISDFDLTAIAYLYGVDGFQNPNKSVFSDSKFTADDYLNFDVSTYTTTSVPTTPTIPSQSKTVLPEWIKNNAKWWSEGSIGDNDFLSGVEYMIKENIMVIPDLTEEVTQMELKDEKRAMGMEREQNVPDWVRNNAGWWADGLISEDDFLNGIKYLVEKGIIKI